ncbi:MAG: hypothetical protein ACXAAH_03235 [Promethearchaeota archaeon]
MPECLECGLNIKYMESGVGDVRCYDCEYRNNLKKAIRKTSLYCLISIALLGLWGYTQFLILSAIF